MGTFLDASARAGLLDAVRAVESASAAELVISIRERSGSYRDAALIAGAGAAFVVLFLQLFSPWEFSLLAIQLAPFAAGIAFSFLASRVPPLLRSLTTRAERERRVRMAALATFHERGIDETTGRTGLLLYVSLLERDAELVADRGVRAAVDPAALQAVTHRLRRAVAEHDAGALATAMSALTEVLAAALPRAQGDVDELPDAVAVA